MQISSTGYFNFSQRLIPRARFPSLESTNFLQISLEKDPKRSRSRPNGWTQIRASHALSTFKVCVLRTFILDLYISPPHHHLLVFVTLPSSSPLLPFHLYPHVRDLDTHTEQSIGVVRRRRHSDVVRCRHWLFSLSLCKITSARPSPTEAAAADTQPLQPVEVWRPSED